MCVLKIKRMDLSKIFLNEDPTSPLVHLNDLAEAVIRVSEYYCNWPARHITLQKVERVFAYELYYQFKLLTASKAVYQGIRFDGEIGKQIHQIPNDCGTNISIKQIDYSPDLVLHKSQLDKSSENQKLIIEIKTTNVSDADFALAIIKLNHFLSSLNFQFAVLITVNTNKYTIIRKLRRIIPQPSDKVLINNFKKIIVFNYKDRVLNANRLYDILKGSS